MEDHKTVYREETYELLAELETSLLELEDTPENTDLINQVFRSMHTIKGSGAMFGFENIATFTHEIETVYDLVRDGRIPVSKNLIDLTLSACDLIKKMVCESFEVSEQELVYKSRKQRIVKPRQVAIFLSKKYTDQPIKTIGASFKRYHATAIYSINAVEKEMEQKGQRYEQIRYLADKLESGSF